MLLRVKNNIEVNGGGHTYTPKVKYGNVVRERLLSNRMFHI